MVVKIMKAIFEVVKFNVNDIVTTSGDEWDPANCTELDLPEQ
jgi:hypothetical protein